jgi:hypothetical protein
MKKSIIYLLSAILLAAAGGCTVTAYHSPTGERFTRASLGTTAAVSELTVTGDTNGVRTLSLKGYSTDQAQALSAVTSAAVTAALQSVKPTP